MASSSAMRAVTALEKCAQEESVAQEMNYPDDDVEQLYEAMNPGPTSYWKEQWLMMFTGISSILGMPSYMETFNAAASNTKMGLENLIHMVKTMVEEAYNSGLANGALMANTIGLLKYWHVLIDLPTMYSSHSVLHQI